MHNAIAFTAYQETVVTNCVHIGMRQFPVLKGPEDRESLGRASQFSKLLQNVDDTLAKALNHYVQLQKAPATE